MLEDDSKDIDNKPPWVPKWVWSSYLTGSNSLKGASQLVEAESCASIWKAIERRLDVPSRIDAARLFMAVENALNFRGSAAMGASERKRRATAISEAIRTINLEMEVAEIPLKRTEEFASSVSTPAAIEEAGFVGSLFHGTVGKGIESESFGIGANAAAILLIELHLPNLLQAIAADAQDWAEEAIVHRPKKINAARTYFIRSVTKFFIKSYGEPLRSATLTMASLFFDCQNLSEADIAALAPVSKTNRRKNF